MIKLLPLSAIAVAIAAVLPPAVQANEPGIPRSERLFGRLDTNSDGRRTRRCSPRRRAAS